MTHSILPPSSAGIWGKPDGCTGWVMMNQMFPETEETIESKEGTASHWVVSEVLESYQTGSAILTCDMLIGEIAPNGIVITEEMTDAADVHVQDVLAVCQAYGLLGDMAVESKVQIPRVHALCFGTPDTYIFDQKNGVLYVWDYKYGHDKVEVFENWQSITYVAGILDEIAADGYQEQHLTVVIRIVQPRAYHREGMVREWRTTAANLRAHINVLNANGEKALGIEPICNSGDHCKNCNARHSCEAALTGGTQLFEAAAQPLPLEMSPHAIGVQLAIIRRAQRQLKGLESGYATQVESLIKGGAVVPGWMTTPSFGNKDWNKPLDEVIAMGELFGQDLRQKKPVTPNQAIKLGVDETVITEYSTTPRTGVSVVPDNGNKAKQVFSK